MPLARTNVCFEGKNGHDAGVTAKAVTGSRMDPLTLFGLFAVTLMLITYALEDRSPWFILAFAAACALASVYGFLQGAWPFGVIEAIFAGVAVCRWRTCTAL